MKRISCKFLVVLTVWSLACSAMAGAGATMVSEVATHVEDISSGQNAVPVYVNGDVRYFGDISLSEVLEAISLIADKFVDGEAVIRVMNWRVYPPELNPHGSEKLREFFAVWTCRERDTRDRDWCRTGLCYDFQIVDGQVVGGQHPETFFAD